MTDNPPISVYVNNIEKTFKIKTWYYLELSTPEIMNLTGSTKNKITNDKNGRNVSQREITRVVLVHYNIVNNHYQDDSSV